MDGGTAPGDEAKGSELPFAVRPRYLSPHYPRAVRDVVLALVIGTPLVAALAGLLGGAAPTTTKIRTPAAEMAVTAPGILRSGNWFEMEVDVRPAADVADLTLTIDRGLWHRLSVDTMVPDAESAESTKGEYRYRFGPVKAGETFRLKIDGQIQPAALRWLEGAITASDGERPLAQLPVRITVLP